MSDTAIDDDRLAELLLNWEDRYEQGEDVSAADLCPDEPHLIPHLAVQIDLLRRVTWMKKDGRPSLTTIDIQAPLPAILAGRYRLDALIGEGGYGQVWRGYDLELQRPVAVKLPLPRHAGAHNDGEDRILAEARKVARLTHPGIVPVHDVGQHGAGYFIVSELVEGEDLARRLKAGTISIREAVRIVSEAARHLHYAHLQGFVHRDIKPANLLLDKHDRLFVTDFGIAISSGDAGSAADGAGTLAYMAPEQLFADGTRVDPRTDVYALGVVLYWAVTGQLPFPASSPPTLRQQILHTEPPSPRSINKAIPHEIDRICMKCLAKSPVNRPQTSEELAERLTRWLSRQSQYRKAIRLVTVVATFVFIGIMLSYLLSSHESEQANLQPSHESEQATDLRAAVNCPADRLGVEVELFNGRDLTGWSFHSAEVKEGGVPKQAKVGEVLRVADGVLKCEAFPKYWLRSESSYEDFRLRVEYRFPEEPRWQTGVSVLVKMADTEPEALWRIKAGGWATGRIVKPFEGLPQRSGGREPLPGLAEAEKPVGAWNELEVVCVGKAMVVRVNGAQVNQLWPVPMHAGPIGLAPQGCAVEFRRIRVCPIGG